MLLGAWTFVRHAQAPVRWLFGFLPAMAFLAVCTQGIVSYLAGDFV
jgi:hypothetical protein